MNSLDLHPAVVGEIGLEALGYPGRWAVELRGTIDVLVLKQSITIDLFLDEVVIFSLYTFDIGVAQFTA